MLVLCVVAVAACVGAAVANAGPFAAMSVTLSAQTTVVNPPLLTTFLFGKISANEADEVVLIQGQECGVAGGFWRELGEARTVAGGEWRVRQWVRTATVFRAVWKGTPSSTVTIKPRVMLTLFKRPNGYAIRVWGLAGRWHHKRVAIERFDARLGKWRGLTTIKVSEEYAGSADYEGLRLRVKKGTRLRASMTDAQAAPCYLGGASRVIRS
jgi:hypothetical protein